MAGIDDNISLIGDWALFSPSPRAFLSNFLGDGFSPRPIPILPQQNGNEMPSSEQSAAVSKVGDVKLEVDDDRLFAECSAFCAPKTGFRGGLLERLAARAGFIAPRLDTAARSGSTTTNLGSSSSPEQRSPYVTIPPGLSPTTLLESPAFPSNSLVEPTIIQQQPFPSPQVSVKPELSDQSHCVDASAHQCQNQQEAHLQHSFTGSSDRKDPSGDSAFPLKSAVGLQGLEDSPPPDAQPEAEEQKSEFSPASVGQTAEDGYNWRKYGQKQVKGSEYPRGYYKCTHPNCPVKKKIERSREGHITEIIYKGAHNHPKPPPNRRTALLSSQPFGDMQIDGSENHGQQAGVGTWAKLQDGTAALSDCMEVTSSASVGAELGGASSVMQVEDCSRYEFADSINFSSTLLVEEEEVDQATHGNVTISDDAEDGESELKRRKLDMSALDVTAASRAAREPRVVVQTTSEVDILDDGYRWRKYGQKVVKGNPNPRSYYKCTSAGCNVRKHVERASHDLKSVITSYEGKHNHEVPLARSSSHASYGSSGTTATLTSQSHSIHGRAEPPGVQDSTTRFNVASALAAFGLSRSTQPGPPAGLGFRLVQQGITNLGMAGLGTSGPMQMLPPLHPSSGQELVNGNGFLIPKGEAKVEPMPETSLPNIALLYQQIMSRLPLGS